MIIPAGCKDGRMRSVIQSLLVAIILFLADLLLVEDIVIRTRWNILMTAITLPMYVAGTQIHQLHTE